MRSKIIVISVLVVFLIGVGFLVVTRERPSTKTASTQVTSSDVNSKKWETKTDDQANITVAVTPLDLLPQSKEWKFSVNMNTHTVNLGQDMTKVAVLVDDQGKEYLPTTWTGDQSDGHHREGILRFEPIVPASKSIELKIRDVGQSTVRVFKWQIIK
jgi:hypothetical protein